MTFRSRAATRSVPPAAAPPPMTACACTGRSFEEVLFRMRRGGLSTAEAESLTGCGSICTACIPDLRTFLGRPERPHSREESRP